MWVDAAQAWAPTFVAAVVAGVTWWQNSWQKRTAQRQHALEFQVLQLSLLDRRLGVLKVVSGVLERVSHHSNPNRPESLFNCLLEGQTLFKGELARRLKQAWEDQWRYHNLRLTRANMPSSRESELLDEELNSKRQKLFDDVKKLRDEMIEASRVEALLTE